MTKPPTKFLRLSKDGYFNTLPIYQELWESCKGKVAEERIAAGTAQLTSSGTLTLTMQEIKIMLAKCIELADSATRGSAGAIPTSGCSATRCSSRPPPSAVARTTWSTP